MSDKSQTTKQHYVPVCYLANFGTDGNKGRESTVYYLNIVDNKRGISGVESFPKEKGFYDIDSLGEDKDVFERLFTQLEGEFSSCLRKLIGLVVVNASERISDKVLLPSEDKSVFAAQLAMQITRTRSFRDWLIGNYTQLKEGLSKFNLPEGTIPEYGADDFRRLHMRFLSSFRSQNFYANMFEDRNWAVLVNHTGVPFVTSDNPIVMIDSDPSDKTPQSAASPKYGYYFPITPQIALVILDKRLLTKDLSYCDIYDDKLVLGNNYRMLAHCTRFLFSNVDFNTIPGFVGEKG